LWYDLTMTRVKLPKTVDDVVNDIKRQIVELENVIITTENEIKKTIHDRWLVEGGCLTCNGRGWTVVWDTLDMMDGSCAEYNVCSNPACTAKTLGPDLGCKRSKYDDRKGTPWIVWNKEPMWLATVKPFTDMLNKLNLQLARLRIEPRKADTVVIVKGVKAPVGFVGTVFWIGMSKKGFARIGLKAEDATGKEVVQWTSPTNVARIWEEI
jgi:hypothetical protein